MIKVKVCGLTRLEDALFAASLGAHAVGFIFYPKSPRFVSPERAAEISRRLPPFVLRVGVFVNEEPWRIREIQKRVGLDLVQLHGDEPPHFCAQFFPRVIKAFRIREERDLDKIPPYRGKISAILLDTYVKGLAGGTGRTFDWAIARRAKAFGLPVILAGGIGPENAARALEEVSPYGLDVNSGVECSPGRKHPALLRLLFARLRPFL